MEPQRIIRLMDYVEQAADPRKDKGKRYEWRVLQAIICGALLSGHKTVGAIVQWAGLHAQDLITWLGIKKRRIPSASTLYRVVRRVDIHMLEGCIAQYGQAVDEAERASRGIRCPDGRVLQGQAIDGKEVRGASAHGEKVHLVSLVRHGSGITLGQQRVESKTNEIRAAPKLLESLDLSDTVTTSDAILTQRRLAQQILDQQGDYLMIVKRNQGGLWEAIDVLFQEPPLPPDEEDRLSYTYTNTGHGRIETRTLSSSAALNDYLDWPGVAQVMQRTCRRVIVKTGQVSQETEYAITSLSRHTAGPEQLESLWRGHWTIENRDHYVRDETMGEDRCQVHTGQAAQTLAALRNGIITALRYQGWHNIAEALRHYGNSVQQALCLIGAITT